MTRDRQKKEAVERMKIIGIYPETIEQFDKEDLVSQSLGPYAACYWIEGDQKKRVEEFEREHGFLVYHVISHRLDLGGELMDCEVYLFVSNDREEWQADREDLEDPEALQAYCYVNNLSAPDFSDFGAVGIKVGAAGGLLRIW